MSGIETTGVTVTLHVATKAPLTVLTVITDVPAVTAVTKPEPETVATLGLLLLHTTFLLVALFGLTVAVKV